jgi:hypothetical protein
MGMIFALWLPILLTTAVLFFASFLAWVVLPHHKPDVKRWPDEDKLLAFIRDSNAEPGEYMFPLIDDKDMKADWAQKRYAAGPWGMVNLWSAQPAMGRNMAMTVLFFFVVTILVAYVGAAALPPGASFGEVFQIVGTTAILAHCAGGVCREIWFTRPLRAKLMDLLDGLAYGVITGVIFALLWV